MYISSYMAEYKINDTRIRENYDALSFGASQINGNA